MAEFIDDIHFQALAAKDPAEVCRRTGCTYDQRSRSYSLKFWGEEYTVSPDRCSVDKAAGGEKSLHEYFFLFIVHYLLSSGSNEIKNEWISEKDIPGGTTFFRGPHEIPAHRISSRFGNDLEAFKTACERLNGTPIDMADAAFRFDITNRIPVAVLYWTGDDEFPAEAKVLYDRTIMDHLASDIVYALAVGICQRLSEVSAD